MRGCKVLMVGPKSFSPVIGGIETHVYEIAKRMSERGIKVTVIVPCTYDAPRSASVQGVSVVRVPSKSRRFTTKLTMIPFVVREPRRGKYDIVHAHDATSGFARTLFPPARSCTLCTDLRSIPRIGRHRSGRTYSSCNGLP